MRPSTIQLDQNMRALVAEFARRDMCYLDVSVFLGCSPSSARNYVKRLLAAGVVAPRRSGGAGVRVRTVYRGRREPPASGPEAVPPPLRDPLVCALFGRS